MLTSLSFGAAAEPRTPKSVLDPIGTLVSNRKGGTTRALAPAPVIDRYPLVIGSNLSLQYLSSVYRLCLTGWRYAYVDALNELLEHDPHVRGVVRQRVLPIAGAALSVQAATLPEGDKDVDLAKAIAAEVQRQLDNLPSRTQNFGQLAWGGIYGVSGAEIEWERTPDANVKWEVRRLHTIHSRRLNYTNPGSWDVYVWDQGAVMGPGALGPTNGPFGLRVADYPGKFIVHAPALNGDYPTRDGEGRYIAFYMAMKRMVVRATAQDFERTIRPWVLGTYNRDLDGSGGKDPIADDDDRAALQNVMASLGTGGLNYGMIPNSTKIEILRAASQLSALQFLEYIDAQTTKALLGQTFTTQPGAHGNRSAADTAKQGTLEVQRYEAQCFADTLERDLVWWIVALNWGTDVAKRLTPRLIARVEEKPDPEMRAKVAQLLTSQDVPLDADDLADRCGFKVTPKPDGPDGAPRRTRHINPGSPPTPTPEEEPVGQTPTDDLPEDAEIGGGPEAPASAAPAIEQLEPEPDLEDLTRSAAPTGDPTASPATAAPKGKPTK